MVSLSCTLSLVCKTLVSRHFGLSETHYAERVAGLSHLLVRTVAEADGGMMGVLRKRVSQPMRGGERRQLVYNVARNY